MDDLNSLDTRSDEGAVMNVLHPATNLPLTFDDGTAVTVTLCGVDSERFRKVQRAQSERRMNNPRRRAVTAETLENEALEGLAACTVAWTGMVLDGQHLDCTPANVRMLYQRLPWLREQVDFFIGDRSNFLKASPTN